MSEQLGWTSTRARWQWHIATGPGADLADELTLLTATGLLP